MSECRRSRPSHTPHRPTSKRVWRCLLTFTRMHQQQAHHKKKRDYSTMTLLSPSRALFVPPPLFLRADCWPLDNTHTSVGWAVKTTRHDPSLPQPATWYRESVETTSMSSKRRALLLNLSIPLAQRHAWNSSASSSFSICRGSWRHRLYVTICVLLLVFVQRNTVWFNPVLWDISLWRDQCARSTTARDTAHRKLVFPSEAHVTSFPFQSSRSFE